MKLELLLIIPIVFLNSCRPLKNCATPALEPEPVKKTNFSELNGKYENLQSEGFGRIESHTGGNTNYLMLFDRLFSLRSRQAGKGSAVELEFISPRKVSVKLYEGDSLLIVKKLRGKFKKGYFYLRPKGFIVPFFPVFYMHHFSRIRIGQTRDDLVIDYTINEWGFALIAGGWTRGRSTSIYQRETK